MAQRLAALAADGQLIPVQIEGSPGTVSPGTGAPGPAYVHPDRLGLLNEVTSGNREPSLTTVLSPFDPLVWDRQRARELFGFDYQIECYTPGPKRRYGYFTLPILHRGRLVGRLDAKAHRKQGLFEVKAVHLEPDVAPEAELAADLARTLRDFAAWHGTPDVIVRASDPPAFAPLLAAQL